MSRYYKGPDKTRCHGLKIPVLLYHDVLPENVKVVDPIRQRYTISLSEFERQIASLKEMGYSGITVDEYFSMTPESTEQSKPILLTFDDGHHSQFDYAFPVLERYGMKASFFLTVNWIGRPEFMDWEQVRTLSAAGMSIQSHTLNHVFLTKLMSLQVVEELRSSRLYLEDQIGRQVRFLSLPGGRCDRSIWQMAGMYGYRGVLTSVFGYGNFKPYWEKIHPNGYVPVGIKRIPIDCNLNQRRFEALVQKKTWAIIPFEIRYWIGCVGKKVLGNQLYDQLWTLKQQKQGKNTDSERLFVSEHESSIATSKIYSL